MKLKKDGEASKVSWQQWLLEFCSKNDWINYQWSHKIQCLMIVTKCSVCIFRLIDKALTFKSRLIPFLILHSSLVWITKWELLHAAASTETFYIPTVLASVLCGYVGLFFYLIFILQQKFTVGSSSASSSFLVLFISVFFRGSLSMCDLHSLWFSESKTYVPATRPERKNPTQLQALKRDVEFKATFLFNGKKKIEKNKKNKSHN